ncbi:MAG: tRNA (adenosine(37)-N6)-dimethylallyltransferase MiaA [Deltaproteobacteria bacterium]|nr:tRNA (adenosine(37)-N6)-dimethylallyltransferase MiaA [Deltaproteobacteria bacterium]
MTGPDAIARRPPPVVAILGPTASGKSALALALAEILDGEILCCDSVQVYRGMDIGTAKATPAERAAIPHHLFDLVAPDQQFHAAAWAEAARACVASVVARGRLPIIVGGTGLYYRALVKGLFVAPKADPAIRARHQAEAKEMGIAVLLERLHAIDPEAAAKILPGDLVRTSRALEVYEQTGMTISALRRCRAEKPPPLCLFSVLLDFSLEHLRPRIGSRVDAMMTAGFLAEVRALREAGHVASRAMQALGYKQLGQHLDGALSLDEAISAIKSATVAYARRQRTWFRREEIHLRAGHPLVPGALAGLVRGFFVAQAADLRLWRVGRIVSP